MTDTTDPDRRDVRLEDPAERWEQREGFLTRLVIGWDGSTTTTTQLRAEELQDVVNAAALQYGIRPECLCYLAGLSGPQNEDDCPRHKGESS